MDSTFHVAHGNSQAVKSETFRFRLLLCLVSLFHLVHKYYLMKSFATITFSRLCPFIILGIICVSDSSSKHGDIIIKSTTF